MAQENVSRAQSQKGASQQAPEQQQQKGRTEVESQAGGQSTEIARREAFLPSVFGGLPASPFRFMRQMMEDMDRMFENFGFGRQLMPFERGGSLERAGMGAIWSPQIEVLEREGNLVVRADLPGMKQEDIRVEVQPDNTLVLSGERKQEQEETRRGMWRSERSYGAFCRAVPLPEGVEAENVTANFDNGVLEVSVKLPETQQQQQPKRIEVKGGTATEAQTGPEGEQKPPIH